jgi:hypothetical protein
MQQTILIDCWPNAQLAEFYSTIREHLLSQPLDAQWLWASYESGDLDSHFLALLRDHRSRMITQPMTKDTNDVYRVHSQVQIMGRSWLHCVHGRPLGIYDLLRMGVTVQIDPRFITHQLSNGKGERVITDQDIAQDVLPWQQIDQHTWQLNRKMITDPHWEF